MASGFNISSQTLGMCLAQQGMSRIQDVYLLMISDTTKEWLELYLNIAICFLCNSDTSMVNNGVMGMESI